MTQSEGVRSVPLAVVPCFFPNLIYLSVPCSTMFNVIQRICIIIRLSQRFVHCLTRAAPAHRANTGNTNKREIKESLASASQISQENTIAIFQREKSLLDGVSIFHPKLLVDNISLAG